MKERSTSTVWFPFWADKWIFGSVRIECTLEERAVWIDLLSLASKDNGYIRANEDTAYPLMQLSGMLIIPEDKLKGAIEKFIEIGKLKKDKNGTLYIKKWDKYQFSDRWRRELEKDSKSRGTSGKTEHTSEKSAIYNTIQKNTIQKNRREEENDINPIEQKILNELKKVKDYPYDFNDTIKYIRELAVEFPNIDILDEIKGKVAWWHDNPLTKKSNPHLQLRNWLKNSIKFNAERRRDLMVGGRSDNEKVMARYEKQRLAGDFDDLDKED